MAKALDDILKEGWKHGPLGCLGDCKTDSVPCKTGARPGRQRAPHAQPQTRAACSTRARRAIGRWVIFLTGHTPWLLDAGALDPRLRADLRASISRSGPAILDTIPTATWYLGNGRRRCCRPRTRGALPWPSEFTLGALRGFLGGYVPRSDARSRPRAAIVGCPLPCVQYGITEKALGHNCILGCCFAGAPIAPLLPRAVSVHD
jgi:hypothetical protein